MEIISDIHIDPNVHFSSVMVDCSNMLMKRQRQVQLMEFGINFLFWKFIKFVRGTSLVSSSGPGR